MSNQVQGEILFQGMNKTNDEWVYTPWMPVRGDKATFGIEILQIYGINPLTWMVETRTQEDPTTLTNVTAEQTANSTGVALVEADALSNDAQQLVRYKFSTGTTPDASKWVQVRALEPSWQFDR